MLAGTHLLKVAVNGLCLVIGKLHSNWSQLPSLNPRRIKYLQVFIADETL